MFIPGVVRLSTMVKMVVQIMIGTLYLAGFLKIMGKIKNCHITDQSKIFQVDYCQAVTPFRQKLEKLAVYG